MTKKQGQRNTAGHKESNRIVSLAVSADAQSAIRTPQIVVCASRIPEPDRQRFLELIGNGADLARIGAQLRNEAWSLYRRHVPAAPRAEAQQSQSPRGAKLAE